MSLSYSEDRMIVVVGLPRLILTQCQRVHHGRI